ncbi:MAG: hypothetical protein IIC02_06875 [Planctomycetes bacterium]|nr:hypothetical protein [Planctomycetota bacterium]
MASTQHDHDEFVAADDTVIGRAFRWSVVVIAVLVIVVGAGVWAFRRPAAVAPPQVLDVVPPATNCCPKPWARVPRFSITTMTATRTCFW